MCQGELLDTSAYIIRNVTQGTVYTVKCDLKARQRTIVQAGGLLNYTKMGSKVS